MNSQVRWTNYPGTPTGNGIKVTDIKGYKSLTTPAKRKARQRASNLLLKSMEVGKSFKQTSILPPYMIQELWNTEVNCKDRDKFQLITEEAFDGGTNFYIKINRKYFS